MRLATVARLYACALLGLSPVLLGHCGKATNGDLMGTETGNPPVVDSQKLRLVASAAGLELIGQAGAVDAGAQVRVDNRSTGASAMVTANGDGSFRLGVPGSALDEYEVTITEQGGTLTLRVSVEDVDASSTPAELSCEQLESSLVLELGSAFAPFAQGCSTNSDCDRQFWNVGCYQACGYSVVMAEQRAAALAAAEQSTESTCSELEQRCQLFPPSCPAPAPVVPECYEGTCRELSVADLSCQALESQASQRAGELMREAAQGCTVDADCALAYFDELSCVATCGGYQPALRPAAEARVRDGLSAIDFAICGAFLRNDCPAPTPLPCGPQPEPEPEWRAVCSNNQCERQAVPSP